MTIQFSVRKENGIKMSNRAEDITVKVIQRIENNAKVRFGIKLPDVVKEDIYKFLICHVTSGVRVAFTKQLPEGKYTHIKSGEFSMKLLYVKNVDEADVYPNILYVKISKVKETKFKEFWSSNRLPKSLLEEAIKIVNLHGMVKVEIFANPTDWDTKRFGEKDEVIYIGQQPNPKNGQFISKQPVGYFVKPNYLIIFAPNRKMTRKHEYCTFFG